MNVKSGTPCQPSLDLGMLMRGVVVDDEMNIEVTGDVGLDVAQEREELLVMMTDLHWVITAPVAMSRAANRVVVPSRL